MTTNLRAKEKGDVDELEIETTKRLFLEQGTWDSKHKKEMQEYLDARNKEVRAFLCCLTDLETLSETPMPQPSSG